MTWVLAGVAAVAGCKSDADEGTLDGVEALKNCDIHAAHEQFAEAHADDPEHPQAALGFGLTDLALLPEDPIVTELLGRVGFTAAIDMQVLVFGEDGLLARAARMNSCDSLEQFARETIPYPPLQDETIDEIGLIDPALKGTHIRQALADLIPRFNAIADALETAADEMAEPVTIEGGCGLGTITVQAPELYLAAGLLRGIVSLTNLADAYDWSIGIQDLAWALDVDTPQQIVNVIQPTIGSLSGNGPGAARDTMASALALIKQGLEAAKVTDLDENALFDWTALPAPRADDLIRLVDSASLALGGPAPVADISPTLTVDLLTLFDNPPDLQAGDPLFYVDTTDPEFPYWDVSQTALEQSLGTLTTPNVFSDTTDLQWAASSAWETYDESGIWLPAERYRTVYECASAP